jgi:glycosyltransferase involved in cell wall biosynthesis
MIWNDGSAWAYGRGGDPSAPQYCYPREVDYCSAACLLVSRSLFTRLGGFDERYAPAYYEETDLCMAIAEAGFKTVYEPRAVVFHLEFGSSDGQDSIALQLRNRELFVEKWEAPLRERLAPAQENVIAARDSRRSKRVLVVDDRIPECGQGSGFPRAVALLESLVALGYAVTLMPVRDRRPLEPALSQLQGLGVEVLHSVHDVEATLIERAPVYDIAIVSRPHNLPLANAIREASRRTALIYDAEAVVAARDVLEAEVEGRYVPAAEREAMITAELDAIGSADLVLTVSQPEQRMMQEHGDYRVEVWGHCLPVEKPQRRYRERHDLLFVGSLATSPNADAVSHLLNRILPAVRKRLSARLLIVGADPAPRLWAAPLEATDGVLFTGFVADLAPVYESARVFLAPHRFAAGVPLKVIEAMAHGVPCVVSRLLGDQLELEDGQGVLIADDTEDFAEKVGRLYGDKRFWADQQRKAMQVISERYDPGRMREMLRGFVETAVDVVEARGVATGTGDGH